MVISQLLFNNDITAVCQTLKSA